MHMGGLGRVQAQGCLPGGSATEAVFIHVHRESSHSRPGPRQGSCHTHWDPQQRAGGRCRGPSLGCWWPVAPGPTLGRVYGA